MPRIEASSDAMRSLVAYALIFWIPDVAPVATFSLALLTLHLTLLARASAQLPRFGAP